MRALISGAGGQDGYYLCQYLDQLGYKVYGGYRRGSKLRLPSWVEPIQMEMGEYESVKQAIQKTQPDEIYNLAAQSHVGESFGCPLYTFDINCRGVLRILESIRDTGIRLYQASTSEMFGGGTDLSETSPLNPKSPYAIAKVAAHQSCQMYRKAYGTQVSCGILFNHESPYRGKDFVTQKICLAAQRNLPLKLGNVESRRDWGHAKDYVKAMHLMLQNAPDDYVVATGVHHSVQEWMDETYSYYKWEPDVEISEFEKRPWDVDVLSGDPSKIKSLGWEPEYGFKGLVQDMVGRY